MSNLIQGSPEWHEMRRKHIGASDAPIIMGVSPWKTPYQLWQEKLGLLEDQPESLAMMRGKDLEPVALKCFEDKTGLVMFPQVKKHPTISYMMASLDGVDMDDTCFVEIKCPGKSTHNLALSGVIPDYYYPQIQHQFEVSGLDKGYYFSFDGEDGVAIEMIKDPRYIENMLKKQAEFWHFVETQTPPPLTDRDCEEISNPFFEVLCEIYERLKEEIVEKENDLEETRRQLIAIANGRSVRSGNRKVLKCARKGALDTKRILEDSGLDEEIYRKKPISYWKIL